VSAPVAGAVQRLAERIGARARTFAHALRTDVGRHRRPIGHRDDGVTRGSSRGGCAEFAEELSTGPTRFLCGHTHPVEGVSGGGVPSADAMILTSPCPFTARKMPDAAARRGRTPSRRESSRRRSSSPDDEEKSPLKVDVDG